jgi:hypothetical protein
VTADARAEQAVAQWAIVNLFGHQRIAGRISEQTFGGASFVRVDVPAIEATENVYSRTDDGDAAGVRTVAIQAHTRSFGAAAIYSIDWCDEQTARLAAHSIKHQPVSPYSVKEALDSMPDADRHRLLTNRQRTLDDDPPY